MDLSNYMRNHMNIHDNVNSDQESEEPVRESHYRHKKFYGTVPNRVVDSEDVLDLSSPGPSTPRDRMWRPAQPAFVPQQPAFVPQQPVAQPPRDLNANNPFLLANMPQQKYVPRSALIPGHPQEEHHHLPPVPDFS